MPVRFESCPLGVVASVPFKWARKCMKILNFLGVLQFHVPYIHLFSSQLFVLDASVILWTSY
jgi:hypothetical protein